MGTHKLFLEPLKAHIDERPDNTLVDGILTAELTRYLMRIFIESIRTEKKEQLVYVDET